MFFQSPRVSVIIIADRNYEYLPATVDSVRRQTFADFEVLIFHDATSRNLLQWFDRQSDSRLRLFCREEFNLANILNLGVQKAAGEYIAWLQAGDLWHPHKLQKQVSCLESSPYVGLVHSWLMSIDNYFLSQGKILKHQLSGWVQAEILKCNLISYQSAMVRRSCFDKVGLFDLSLKATPDWDMWIRLSSHYQFMAIAETLVYYRQNRDRVPESWLATETDFQVIIEKAYQDIPKELNVFKNCSYALGSLSLAKQVLQHQKPDYLVAHNYCRQALEQSLRVGLSMEFFQVIVTVITVGWLNSGNRHNHLRVLIKSSQSWLKVISRKFKLSAHLLLSWMLEEESVRTKEQSRILRNEE